VRPEEAASDGEKSMENLSMKLFAIAIMASCLNLGLRLARGQSGKAPPKAVSLTGCLVKGDEPKEVWLAQKDGRIYRLESSKIELNAHLGHKVIVTGYALPERKEEAGEEAQKQNETGKRESADFRVLTLRVINTTCR
jgi:hypothetical protein